jgi:helicase
MIGLSATIGNAEEICEWLEADLVYDEWRPVELHHLVLAGDELSRYK